MHRRGLVLLLLLGGCASRRTTPTVPTVVVDVLETDVVEAATPRSSVLELLPGNTPSLRSSWLSDDAGTNGDVVPSRGTMTYDFEDDVYGTRASSVGVAAVYPRTGSVPATIRQTVQQHETGITQCFAAARALVPSLEGRIVLSFVIGTNGQVLAASVRESNRPGIANAGQCLTSLFRTMRFPSPPSVLVVNYPLVFAP